MGYNVINIQWHGGYSLNELTELNNVSKDYGVYQLYGSHPVCGSNVLLYIGKAVHQTFANRVRVRPTSSAPTIEAQNPLFIKGFFLLVSTGKTKSSRRWGSAAWPSTSGRPESRAKSVIVGTAPNVFGLGQSLPREQIAAILDRLELLD